MFVYLQTENNLYTVGHYDPSGKWIPESDHATPEQAGQRVAYLNGWCPLPENFSIIPEALRLAVNQIAYDRPEFFEEDETRLGWEANLEQIKQARTLAESLLNV